MLKSFLSVEVVSHAMCHRFISSVALRWHFRPAVYIYCHVPGVQTSPLAETC